MQVTITLRLATWNAEGETYEDDVNGLGPHAFTLHKVYATIEMVDYRGLRAVKQFSFPKTQLHSDILRQINNWLASEESAKYFEEQTQCLTD